MARMDCIGICINWNHTAWDDTFDTSIARPSQKLVEMPTQAGWSSPFEVTQVEIPYAQSLWRIASATVTF